MKRPNDVTPEGVPQAVASDEKFLRKYPEITAYLSDTSWEDGAAREPSALSVFIEGGMFKVAMNDKDLRRSLYISGVTFEAAMASLETALGKSQADWRSWVKGKGRK